MIINISNNMTKNQDLKFLTLSFMLHSAVFLFYLLYIYNDSPIVSVQEKMIVLELEHIIMPNVETPEPVIQPVKKIEPQKIEEEMVKQEPIKLPAEPIKPVELPKVEPIVPQKIVEPIKPTEIPKVKPIAPKKIAKKMPKIVRSVVMPAPMVTNTRAVKARSITTPPNAAAISKTDYAIIRNKVLSNLEYPNIAKRMSWQGITQIALKIDPNGKLVSAKIDRSSGKTLLDEAALLAAIGLKNSQLPRPQTTVTIILPVAFKLQ